MIVSNDNTHPGVSVVMITYGHEKFIEAAVKGVLSQECDFPVELIIANDRSPDGTDQIIHKLLSSEQNAGRIRYILRGKNLGTTENFIDVLESCKEKYIALCDGDDYWTDPQKLQKQVTFLEKNPGYSICHHGFQTLNDDNHFEDEFQKNDIPFDYNIELLCRRNTIGTVSVLFRNKVQQLPAWYKNAASCDYALHIINAANGNIKYFPENMAVYRKHKKGITGNFQSVEGTFFLINTLQPVLESGIIVDQAAAANLKKQLLDCYLILFHHYNYENNFNLRDEYFSKIRALKNIFDAKDINIKDLMSAYIVMIRSGFVAGNPNSTIVLSNDFEDQGYKFLLETYHRHSGQEHDLLNSRSYRLGNSLVKPFKKIFGIFKSR